MDLAFVFDVGRRLAAVEIKGRIAVAERAVSQGDPGIVVAEHGAVLLVSGRVGGDLAQIVVVFRVARPEDLDAEIVAEVFLRGGQRAAAVFRPADACHHAEALRFDEDLSFFVQAAPDRAFEGIIGAAEPFAVPAVREDCGLHVICFLLHSGRLFGKADPFAEGGIFLRVFDEHARDENAFRLAALEVRAGLEALAGFAAEAVQVQAVIPVGAADERQAVGAAVRDRIADAAAQMLQERYFRALFVIERRRLVQDREVAGLLDVSRGAGDEPERIVVEARADVGIPALRERLVLVVGAAVRELDRGDVQDPFPRALRDQVHEAQKVLAAVAEAHAAAGPALVIGSAAAHVEGDHALVLVPDVHHAVQLFLAAFQGEAGKQARPVGAELIHRGVELRFGLKGRQHAMRFFLIDHAGGAEFAVFRILRIAEAEQEGPGLARVELYLQPQHGNRCPARGDAAIGSPFFHGQRLFPAAELPEEGVAVGIEAFDRSIYRIESVVVPALAVFGLMIDRTAFGLHLADVPVALEIGLVVDRVPEAPFDAAVNIQFFFLFAPVRQHELLHFHVGVKGDRDGQRGADAVFPALKDRVAEAVPAAVRIEGRHRRPERRTPDHFPVADVKEPPAFVGRYVVVAETGDPPQLCILIKTVAAAGIADQREKSVISEIIGPRQGRIRARDHVFPGIIVKKAVFHHIFTSSGPMESRFRNGIAVLID